MSTEPPSASHDLAEGERRPTHGQRRPWRQRRERETRTLAPEAIVEHLDRLYRAAWALCGSREDAEDLVQETCARVLQKPRLLRADDDLGYLLRALRNTYFSTRKSAGRRPRVTTTLEDIDPADPDPDTQPEQALAAREVYAVIAELPEPFRLALVAVDVLGLSYRDAARSLHAREATLTTRLYRGRQRVARALDTRNGALAPDATGPLCQR